MRDLVQDLPPQLRAPVRQITSLAETSLWLLPAVVAIGAVLLALVLGQVDPLGRFVPEGLADADAARSAMTAILSATIAATSLVVTGTIVALQLATGQYSPRLLRNVLTDPGVRWSLATLVGVVVYILALLAQVGGEDPPRTAVALGLLLGVSVVGLLVYFVHHILQRLRLETIVGNLVTRTVAAAKATHPPEHEPVDSDVPDHATAIPARRSGYVQTASLEALARAAAEQRVHLRVRPRVGDFLVAGTAAAWAWPADEDDGAALDEAVVDDLVGHVDRALALGTDRTVQGDPAYGLRHLVDIGLRAVSPGINDPTTAVQTIHHATPVLVLLASRPVTNGVAEHDGCRAVLPRPDLADHLELAQAQLLQYGGGDPRVVEALADQLRDVVEGGTRPGRHALVRAQLARLRTDVQRRDHHPDDAELLRTALDRVEAVLVDDSPDDEEGSAG